jgi:hypothetical protein
MNKKLILLVMTICLLAFVAVMAFSQTSPNVRWEYTTTNWIPREEDRFVEKANELGRQGWELVAVDGIYTVYKRRLP